MKRILSALVVVVVAGIAGWLFLGRAAAVPVYPVEVVATLPHDSGAFTEGLFFHDGSLFESTGEIGASTIRRLKPETGEVLQQVDLGPPYFGEGIVAWKDRLLQLTWRDKTGFIYGLKDFTLRDTFPYEGEGWSLTHDDKRLIMSDGTPVLRFLDPETLKTISTLKVTANGCPVEKLNELEWVNGEIYANIWQTSLIARIDPATGKVKSFLDVGKLDPRTGDPDDVANGIAYDAAGKRLFVTGKHWPKLYQVTAAAKPERNEAAESLMRCN